MDENREGREEGFTGWAAFHQAYDSAVRTYRRGENVSRAVNWLALLDREGADPGEIEMERRNRETGVGIGLEAKSEIDIAPIVWKAAQSGRLALDAESAEEAPPEATEPPGEPREEGGGGEEGEKPQEEAPGEPEKKDGEPEGKRDDWAWEYVL